MGVGLDGTLELKGEARADAILDDVRRVLLDPRNATVLAWLLEDHGVLLEAKDERQRVLQNWGHHLLDILGINSTYQLVRALTQSKVKE